MTASTRTTPARLARLTARLADRDVALLDTVAKLRLVSTRQIERLHFQDGSPLSRARACRRALAALADNELLVKLERQIGGVRGGSSGYLWSLGAAGQHLLERRGPAGGPQRRRPWTPSLGFLAHRLAISELYVELVEGSRAGHGELLRFDAEPDCWRRFTGPGGGLTTLKPDAYVLIGIADFEDAWFVEIDLATESPLALQRKCRSYVSHWKSGREQALRDGVYPLVVYVVPHAARASVVQRVIAGLTRAEGVLFRTVTADQAATALLGGDL